MNEERNAEIVRLWNDGFPASKIAPLLNVSSPLVYAIILRRRELGETVRSTSNNVERNKKIVRLWNRGLSTGEVALDVGCTKNMVLATIVKHRALGDITRPMVETRSERGKLGIIAKYGIRRKRK